MTEAFLHYCWQYQLWNTLQLCSAGGQDVHVISPGIHNSDAGPDFFNARIRIGHTLWAGNVEIHLNGSDWRKHGHQHDHAYDNVVLHVVYHHDEQALNKKGQKLPTLVAADYLDRDIFHRYQSMQKKSWAPCVDYMHKADDFTVTTWLERMIVERFEEKSKYIDQLLYFTKNNWAESFYLALAKNFGFKINAEPFERLARSVSHRILMRHRDQTEQVEALLFGQAGFLDEHFADAYPARLQDIYHFLKRKYALIPLEQQTWKYLRLRPSNFPSIRIAQFAALMVQSESLFSRTLNARDLRELRLIFQISASTYWDTHYRFDVPSVKRSKRLGKTGTDNILINTVAPFLFVYGKKKDREALCERALELLGNLPPEQNYIIRKWGDYGIKASSALQSQGLIGLRTRYCIKKKCLHCGIGIQILKHD